MSDHSVVKKLCCLLPNNTEPLHFPEELRQGHWPELILVARVKLEPESSSRHERSTSQGPTFIFLFFIFLLCLLVVILFYIMMAKFELGSNFYFSLLCIFVMSSGCYSLIYNSQVRVRFQLLFFFFFYIFVMSSGCYSLLYNDVLVPTETVFDIDRQSHYRHSD